MPTGPTSVCKDPRVGTAALGCPVELKLDSTAEF